MAPRASRRRLNHQLTSTKHRHGRVVDHASQIMIDYLRYASSTTSLEAEKVCTHCGEAKARIGEDEARVLDFIPARFELQIHVLPKYACSHCRDGVVAPEGPPRPLSGCIAGAGVLAEVVVSKFAEHMPLYRFEDISTRYGFYLPRSTLCDWVRNVANLLKPLYELEKELVQTSPVIWTDDTHVTVIGWRGTRQPQGAVLGLHRPHGRSLRCVRLHGGS